jgi:lysophospholipase L1-like esterase
MSEIRKQIFTLLCLAMLLLSGCTSKPKTVVCIGDSLTACGGKDGRYSDWLGKYLPEHKIINKGINGDTLAGGRGRFQRDVLDINPNVVIIGLGANDFWRKKRTIEELQTDLTDMVKRAKAENIEVVIISCFVSRDYKQKENIEFDSSKFDFAEAIGHMQYQVSKKYSCCYVPNMQIDIKPNGTAPYWDDRNHPNKLGNELIAKRILPELKKAIKRAGGK